MEIRKPSGKLTAEAKQHIIDSHTLGDTVTTIAERLDIIGGAVRRILRRYEVPVIKGDLIPQTVKQEIISAYKGGESSLSIANRLGRSQDQVCYVCRLEGVSKTQRHLSDSDKATILNMYADRKECTEIGKEIGFSTVAVAKYVRESGISRGIYNFTSEEQEEIADAYTGGESSESIAKRLNVTGSCIQRMLKRNGIVLRDTKTAARHRSARSAEALGYCYVWRRTLVAKIRTLTLYKDWREAVLKRDKYRCTQCGSTHKVQADHIYPFSAIIHNYKIESLEQAIECELLWRPDNGRALCSDCHNRTDTHGSRAKRYWVKPDEAD